MADDSYYTENGPTLNLNCDDRRFRARAIPGERCKLGAVIVDADVVD